MFSGYLTLTYAQVVASNTSNEARFESSLMYNNLFHKEVLKKILISYQTLSLAEISWENIEYPRQQLVFRQW